MFKNLIDRLLLSVKEQIKSKTPEAIKHAVDMYFSASGQEKKQKAIDYIFEKINLPWFLKPFKGCIKKSLNKYADDAVQSAYDKIKEKINVS